MSPSFVVRAIVAALVMYFLMFAVWEQIKAVNADGYGTVEQMFTRGGSGLTFDRHFAMPIDFCIIPGTVALAIVLCGNQWEFQSGIIAAGISFVVIMFCLQVLWIGGTEAHVHDHVVTPAGYIHGVYSMVALWAIIMVLAFTPQPEPVLLLILCVVVPAFLFVGQHMFLGMINYAGFATSYPDKPLTNPVAWGLIIAAEGLTVWRSYVLIPNNFWDSLR